MKRIVLYALSILAVSIFAVSCKNSAKKAEAEAEAAAQQAAIEAEQQAAREAAAIEKIASLPEEPEFMIETNYGKIKIKLYSNTPKHRENFAKLALSGYYDGTLFHRVINGFMIQGGDPLSKDPEMINRWGTGGPDYTVPAEILPENTHKKGALSAARTGDAANPLRASSGSQFYLVQDEVNCAQLDGAYTVFGETIEGLSVIDKIASQATDERDRPMTPVVIKSIKLVE